jgi:hypothetical protein
MCIDIDNCTYSYESNKSQSGIAGYDIPVKLIPTSLWAPVIAIHAETWYTNFSMLQNFQVEPRAGNRYRTFGATNSKTLTFW